MNKLVAILGVLSVLGSAWAYPTGAPETVCDDMTPRHGVDPQTSDIPYSVAVSNDKVNASQIVQLVILGKSDFKGFLLEVRDGEQAVGQFQIPESNENAQTLNCHGGNATAATHKNANLKKYVILSWKAPAKPATLSIYVTVVQEGKVFWAKELVGNITVE